MGRGRSWWHTALHTLVFSSNFQPRSQMIYGVRIPLKKIKIKIWDAGSQLVRAWVLTPASDFWIFSLALAMSRRIVLAPFSCKQRRKNQEFLFKKKYIKTLGGKNSSGKLKKKKKKSNERKEEQGNWEFSFP